MVSTVTLHIGQNSSIDGGPHEDARVQEVDPDGGVIWLEQLGDDEVYAVHLGDLVDDLHDEIMTGEPVRVSGQPRGEDTAPVSLPVPAGFELVGGGVRFGADSLRDPDILDRLQQATDEHGATLAAE